MPRQPKGWLLGVARRVLANRRRADRRQVNVAVRLAAEPPAGPPSDEGPPVFEALAQLSADDVEILKLAAWDELSSREAGQVLGCSPVAFRLRLHRARRRLAAALAECERQSDEEPDGVILGMGEPS